MKGRTTFAGIAMAGWRHLEEVDHSSGTGRGRERGSAERSQKNQGGGRERRARSRYQEEKGTAGSGATRGETRGKYTAGAGADARW
jgi:hypothetical protein